MTLRPRHRAGFTLVELLIVMGIIVLVASLAVLFLPNLDRNKGVPNAVTQVQGWFNLSRQSALRDHNPRGIRLIHDGTGKCTQLVYIEQPEPVAPRGPGIKVDIRTIQNGVYDPVLFPTPPNLGSLTVVTLFQDPANQVPPGQYPDPTAYPGVTWLNWDGVLEGDYFQLDGMVHGTAGIRRFTSPPQPGPPGAPPAPPPPYQQSQLVLDRVIEGTESGQSIQMTTGFRVLRAPRPLAGEAPLEMHKDVYIDLTACFPCPLNIDWPAPGQYQQHPSGLAYSFPQPNPPGGYFTGYANWGAQPIPVPNRLPQPVPVDVNYIDVLFNSSGFVANAPVGRYIIAIRHRDRGNDMHFVVIYTRTGKITNHLVNDLPSVDPYSFTQDGSSPGL